MNGESVIILLAVRCTSFFFIQILNIVSKGMNLKTKSDMFALKHEFSLDNQRDNLLDSIGH